MDGHSFRQAMNNTPDEAPYDGVVRRRKTEPMGGGFNSLRRLRKSPGSRRRISCADLGSGTHQGWLFTRKPRKSKWEKCSKWCVVKDTDLFVYADQRDMIAVSRIHLPAFIVTDANKETKKTGAFKLYNEGTSFYFRCTTDESKHRWMNCLQLVSIQYPMCSTDSRSTGDSSGIDIDSSYSNSTSQAYSDIDETDTSSIGEDTQVEVAIRPKKYSINAPTRLKSHMDNNLALRKLVTSIRDADLDLVGTDRDTRRQSQFHKSLAQAGFSRKNSAKNKKIFLLRAKERQKQALEQELSDIEAALNGTTRSKLAHFLSHYPDYQDGLNMDSCSDSASSSQHITSDSHCINNNTAQATPAGACSNLDSLLGVQSAERTTLTPDTMDRENGTPLDLEGLSLSHQSRGSRRGSGPVFAKQKFKQTVTHL